MGGIVGRLFHEFAVTLSAAIFVSGVISLTLTPMMCSRFLKPESAYGEPGWFYRLCEGGFNWLLGGYTAGLRWVLRHQIIMLVVVVLTIAVTMQRYGAVSKGFFPQQDTGLLVGTSEGAAGSFPFDTHAAASRSGLATSSSPIPGWSPSPPSSVRPMAALSRIADGFSSP